MEVVEHACAMASLSMGETVYNAARGIDTHSYKLPLGVTAGICPFNFPAKTLLNYLLIINLSSMHCFIK